MSTPGSAPFVSLTEADVRSLEDICATGATWGDVRAEAYEVGFDAGVAAVVETIRALREEDTYLAPMLR